MSSDTRRHRSAEGRDEAIRRIVRAAIAEFGPTEMAIARGRHAFCDALVHAAAAEARAADVPCRIIEIDQLHAELFRDGLAGCDRLGQTVVALHPELAPSSWSFHASLARRRLRPIWYATAAAIVAQRGAPVRGIAIPSPRGSMPALELATV